MDRMLHLLHIPQHSILCGDFNAHHNLWNSAVQHQIRGDVLVEWFRANNCDLVNHPDISDSVAVTTTVKEKTTSALLPLFTLSNHIALFILAIVRPLLPTKTRRVWRRILCPVCGSGVSTKDTLVEDGVQHRRTIGSIPRTSCIMPVNKNVVCSCVQDS